MKRWIHAATDVDSIKEKISIALLKYIKYELWEQDRYEYYKQIRKQFTVNGRKYVVKNDAKGRLHILNPEGEELYGYSVPTSISQRTTDSMALDIINDAYGDDIDLYNKKVNLGCRVGYTSYGSNSGGDVFFGEYVDRLRRYYTNGVPDGRYGAVTISATWSNHDEDVTWFDNASEAIAFAEDFIEKGANTSSVPGRDGNFGYDYRYYADVIDTETGEELYFDKAESIPVNR